MNAKLINETTGEPIELREISPVGRSHESVVVIPDPRVSRRHALIRRQKGGFWLFDLGSVNGSYLNAKRVTTAQLLRNGDQLRIGHSVFRFEERNAGVPAAEQTMTDITLADVRSQQVVLLVSDIRGFTSLSEKLEPDQLAPIIGSWYAAMERILDAFDGNLDKFIGDCALAYWLDTAPASRLAAVQAAQAMQQACDDVSREHGAVLKEIGLEFQSSAAVHIGTAAYGAFSSQEFTLLGDAVNLTFRLETLTRELDERMVISGDTLDGWNEGQALCRPLGPHHVKGRAQPVEVFALK